MAPPLSPERPFAPPAAAASRRRVAAGGRFLLSRDASEHRCQAVDMSAAGLALRAAVHVRVGERVVCYLDDLGRVEGHVARLLDDGFTLDITAPPARKAQLTERVGRPGAQPGADQVTPSRPRVVLRTPEGRHVAATILTLSRSGAALTCPAPLVVGCTVLLGRRQAQVIRVAQRLLAVEFTPALPLDEFSADMVL